LEFQFSEDKSNDLSWSLAALSCPGFITYLRSGRFDLLEKALNSQDIAVEFGPEEGLRTKVENSRHGPQRYVLDNA
jgi:hypothetical protein